MKPQILIIVLFLTLISCKSNGQKSEDKSIIFLTDYYADFVNAVKLSKENSDSLYRVKVQNPILNNYFSSSEYSFLVNEFLNNPIHNTIELQKTIDRLKIERETIIKNVTDALKDSRTLIKNDSVLVYILPANPDNKFIVERMGGVMALTAGSNQILLFIDPEIKGWVEMLKYSVAHEYHHTCWTKNNFARTTKWTLIEYLIFEGRADSYAHLIYPNIKAPWTDALSENEKTMLWDRIKVNLESTDNSLQQEIMFGSANYHYWGGYTLGYDIVQKYLNENQGVTPDVWTNLDGDMILSKSKYK